MKLWGGPTADVSLAAGNGSGTLRPRFSTVVYRSVDETSVEVYLTDLPLARIADLADTLEGASGSIVHIAKFLQPGAGSTPIDPTACSGAVRCLVVADGAAGLYGGGGFITTDEPGDDRMSGSVRGGSARLLRATPDFADLLGPLALQGKFTARYDGEACRALAQRMQDASMALKPVEPAAKAASSSQRQGPG